LALWADSICPAVRLFCCFVLARICLPFQTNLYHQFFEPFCLYTAIVHLTLIALEKINFSYVVKGGNEHIRPLRVFDDGATCCSEIGRMRVSAATAVAASCIIEVESQRGGKLRLVPVWIGELRIIENPDLPLKQERCHSAREADSGQRAENQHPVEASQNAHYLCGVPLGQKFCAHPEIITGPVWFRLRRFRVTIPAKI